MDVYGRYNFNILQPWLRPFRFWCVLIFDLMYLKILGKHVPDTLKWALLSTDQHTQAGSTGGRHGNSSALPCKGHMVVAQTHPSDWWCVNGKTNGLRKPPLDKYHMGYCLLDVYIIYIYIYTRSIVIVFIWSIYRSIWFILNHFGMNFTGVSMTCWFIGQCSGISRHARRPVQKQPIRDVGFTFGGWKKSCTSW